MGLSQNFAEQLSEAGSRLALITEVDSALPYRDGSWTRKQLLGHLIDSAANNHNRFVRASLEPEYRGPRYEQEEWVSRHGYESVPWSELVTWWTSLNQMIARVVERTPAEQYSVQCFIGDLPPMSLQALIEDYLDHMQHHLTQMFA